MVAGATTISAPTHATKSGYRKYGQLNQPKDTKQLQKTSSQIDNTEMQKNDDSKNWNFALLDVFKPKTLFNKTLNRILYPFERMNKLSLVADFKKLKEQGLPLEQKIIKTKDGHSIELWFAKNKNTQARAKAYLHGNGSDIRCFAEEALEDYQKGYSVCLFSYRGYSGNSGYPSEEGLIDDTSSMIDFLKQQGVATDSIDFEAHSLGCAVLLNTLAKRTNDNPKEKFGDLVLKAPFKSMQDMVKAKTLILPRFVINYLTNVWNNLEAISKLKGKIGKLKILHGIDDRLIPVQHSQDLYKRALGTSINAELIELKGIGHNDIKRDME